MNTKEDKAAITPQSPTVAPSDPWEAACALYVGAAKVRKAVRLEYDRVTNEGGNRAQGASMLHDLLNVVSSAEQRLQYDLNRIAHSNRFSIPDVSKI